MSLRNGKVIAYEALSRVTGKYENIIANKPRFCVAAKETLKRAARQAMSRPAEECYDAFAVVDDNRYCGMVTVRDLVRTLAEGE